MEGTRLEGTGFGTEPEGAKQRRKMNMSRAILKSRSAWWVTLSLLFQLAPLRAAGPAPVGILRCEGNVYLGKESGLTASAIYAGDRLRTEEGRASITFSRDDAVVLNPHSGMGIEDSPEGLLIGLEKGRLEFRASPQRGLRVDTEGVAIRASGKFPSFAEISLPGDGSVVVAVRSGEVSVAYLRREPVVVSTGHVLTVNPAVEQSDPKQVGTGAHGKMTVSERLRTFRIDGLSHKASAAIVFGGIAGGTAAAIAIPLSGGGTPVSPSAP